MQGQDQKDVDALATGDVDGAQLSDKERALMEYVKVLTLEPAKVRDTDVERLRKAGWKDEEIFEASFITALFAFFNRMADAYGLDYPASGWLPQDLRPAAPAPAPAK
ncbi:MAG TPA: peroxidase [Armatimonadota bacterium]|nr:peroxidase [Armatimonadota bacterium]